MLRLEENSISSEDISLTNDDDRLYIFDKICIFYQRIVRSFESLRLSLEAK